jgi:N-acetyltransferase
MDLRPVTLRGRHVVLEPLRREHAKDLWAAADERDLWRYMLVDVASPQDLERWVEGRVLAGEQGDALPFLQRDARTGQAIGSTSIFDISREHRTMEVGHTWIGASHRRTAANTEAKLLVLGHCFGALGAIRVQFKTDARNLRSQRAIERLGAHREGVWRSHRILPDGHRRDAVFYSILEAEWPAVEARLRAALAR